MTMQFRSNIIELDGTKTEGEWVTSGTIENYGDCFDVRKTWIDKLTGWVKSYAKA